MKIQLIASLIVSSLLMPVYLMAQDGQADALKRKLEGVSGFLRQAAPEKVFLHLDKDAYHAGDIIWFKAYLVDALTGKAIQEQRNLCVELVDPKGSINQFLLLNSQKGSASGNIGLPDSIPEGTYTLAAYTSRIASHDKGMAFRKEIYIRTTGFENIISQTEIRTNRLINNLVAKRSSAANLYFFPEGGNIIAGHENRVAFRAMDDNGNGLAVSGELLDSGGKIMARIEQVFPGYGSFSFRPEAGVSYKVSASFGGDLKKEFALPLVREKGALIRLTPLDKEVRLDIQAVQLPEPIMEQMYAVFHYMGGITVQKKIDFQDDRYSGVFQYEEFPAGVNYLTLLDAGFNPIAERLFFVPPSRVVSFASNLYLQDIDDKKYFQLALKAVGEQGDPVRGDFSLSVQAGNVSPVNSSGNILSWITFASELKGIHDEVYGHLAASENPVYLVDLLLMTHGWKRYRLGTLLRMDTSTQLEAIAPGIVISGRLYDPVSRNYLTNYPLQIRFAGEKGKTINASTDQEGYFSVDGLYFEGPMKIEFLFRSNPSGIYPELQLLTRDPASMFGPFGQHPQRIIEKGPRWRRSRSTAQTIASSSGSVPEAKSIYGNPDQTIVIDSKLSNYRSMLNVLSDKALGFTVQDGQIVFRGASSVMLSTEPIFILDGSQIDRNTFLSISPSEIQRVEIFKGANAAIFGSRGTNGAIVGYSRRFTAPASGSMEFVIMGYHIATEFYHDVAKSGQIASMYPDYVNTIHWDAAVSTSEEGESVNIFPITQGAGKIKVTIQGIGENGEIGFGEFIYELNR